MKNLYIITITVGLIGGPAVVKAQIPEQAIVYDLSDSPQVKFNVNEVLIKIFKTYDIKNSCTGLKLILVQIGESSYPKAEIIVLEECNKYLTPTHVRQQKVLVFLKKLKASLDHFASLEATQGSSEIYRGLNYTFDLFSENAKRSAWIWSDCIESGNLMDWHRQYKNFPEKLLNDRAEIERIFLEDAPLSQNIKGSDIVILTLGVTELSVQAAELWHQFFDDAKASYVSIQSSLF